MCRESRVGEAEETFVGPWRCFIVAASFQGTRGVVAIVVGVSGIRLLFRRAWMRSFLSNGKWRGSTTRWECDGL